MANGLTKAEKKDLERAERAVRREARREASAEIMAGRMRTGIGFAGAYLLTQTASAFVPSLEEYQATIDLGLAIGGAYLAFTDDGPIGDYAVGAAMVGGIQTLDNVGAKLQELFAKN